MTSTKTPKTKARRNTRAIGFNDAEYQLIVDKALAAGLYPRQFIMLKVKEGK